MPQRHVRFSSTSTVHSLPPLVRSSSSSSASSSGPPTPPPISYRDLPAPSKRRPSSQANDLIALAVPPLLTYDISLSPSTLSTRSATPLSSARLLEPAVFPPLPLISLVTPHLPWTLAVPTTNGKYVTVSDVLSALYCALRVGATPGEFAALRTEELISRVGAAYVRRCERLRGQSRSGYAREQAEGVKRVDFLLGYTTFCGIVPTADPGVWQLKTA
ncbi:hypothetical protein DFH08DRAFT_933733 [Mycena albidolilacea]|uniref:DUF6699 domain-containing protein n=1 Tax=Mycena albidolilacea TaxID=1033008 RepID=A0AAD7AB01_9AGAR|nr:hypothetical protein DFH08DRAFT_933733 [Mycena albidolilacea]